MALGQRQFQDLIATQRKAGGTASGVTMAKKLADLYVSSHTNEAGNVVDPAVYQHAIETYLLPYAGNIDADNAIANYTNSMKKIANKHATSKQAVGNFKLQERDIFFVTPSSSYREDILGDLPTMVSQITDELALHNLEILRAIDTAEANGDNTHELESYLIQSQTRLNKMMELNNDVLTGSVNQGELFNEIGIFIDADQDDGSVRGIGVLPIDGMEGLPGLNKDDFRRIEASTDLGGGFLPVFGTYGQNQWGEWQVNINGNKWSGTGNQPLQFEGRESVNPNLDAEDGAFSISNLQMKTPGIQANRFFRGYTGFDENNNPKEQYYYADAQGMVYSVSDEDVASLRNDPTQSSFIRNATLVDTDFARNIEQSNVVRPYSDAPPPPAQPTPTAVATPAEESGGFFSRAANFVKGLFRAPEGEPQASGTQTSTPSFFANRTNTPSAVQTPQEVGGAAQPNDIIAQGDSFFRSQ